MKTKIKWFKEVLELEPGSKVFFPLARLYFDDGKLKEARDTLRHGLERNPDHLEARFLLVEVLTRLDRHDQAVDEVRVITGMLSNYPAFWKLWADSAAPASRDSAMALTFLAASFQGTPISWTQVIEKGLDSLFKTNGAAAPVEKVAEPEPKAEAPAVKPKAKTSTCEDDASLRTKTMADLLADQGDFQGALTIYEELASSCSVGEGDELEALIEKMRAKLKKGKRSEQQERAEEQVVADEGKDVSLPGADEAVSAVSKVTEPETPEEDAAAENEVAVATDAFDVDEPAEEIVAQAGEELADEPAPMDEDLDLEEVETAPLDDSEMVVDVPEVEIIAEESALDSSDEPLAEPEEVQAAPEGANGEDPATVEEAVTKNMPGREKLLQTLESLADRLEARSAL